MGALQGVRERAPRGSLENVEDAFPDAHNCCPAWQGMLGALWQETQKGRPKSKGPQLLVDPRATTELVVACHVAGGEAAMHGRVCMLFKSPTTTGRRVARALFSLGDETPFF